MSPSLMNPPVISATSPATGSIHQRLRLPTLVMLPAGVMALLHVVHGDAVERYVWATSHATIPAMRTPLTYAIDPAGPFWVMITPAAHVAPRSVERQKE